jgi:hypothetical protein
MSLFNEKYDVSRILKGFNVNSMNKGRSGHNPEGVEYVKPNAMF